MIAINFTVAHKLVLEEANTASSVSPSNLNVYMYEIEIVC